VPAMIAIKTPFKVGAELELAEVELSCGCVLVAEGADWEDPLEVGDEPVRHVLSSETPTILTSELPP